MINSKEVQMDVLKDLIEKMRDLEGSKLRPKAVEVSMTSLKPEPGEGTPEEEHQDAMEGETPDVMEGKTDEIQGEGAQRMGQDDPHGDDLTPEEERIIEELLQEKEG